MGKLGDSSLKKSLARYHNAGLESSAGGPVSIWFRRKLNPPVFKEVARDILFTDPISKEGLVIDHLGKRCAAESARTKSPVWKHSEVHRARYSPGDRLMSGIWTLS